jgi:hypothetical protein
VHEMRRFFDLTVLYISINKIEVISFADLLRWISYIKIIAASIADFPFRPPICIWYNKLVISAICASLVAMIFSEIFVHLSLLQIRIPLPSHDAWEGCLLNFSHYLRWTWQSEETQPSHPGSSQPLTSTFGVHLLQRFHRRDSHAAYVDVMGK